MTKNNKNKKMNTRAARVATTAMVPARGKVSKVPRPVKNVDVDIARYYLALTDPFHPGAVGARVPDMFSCPTVTRTIRATFTMTVNASGVAGALVFPNPVASVCCFNGSCPDFGTSTFGDGSSITYSRWGVDPTAFGNSIDTYRIVGYGIRVTGLSSMTNASGKFVMGAYPINASWATKDFTVGGVTMNTNAAMTPYNTYAAWGVPVSGSTLVPSQFVNLPGSRVVSAIEMSENVFAVTPRLSSPQALQFRDSRDNYQGFDAVSQPAGATVAGDGTYLDLKGHEACYVYYSGGTANTSTFDLEIIYHLEGKPNLSGASQGVTTATVGAGYSQSPAKPIAMFKAIEAAAREPVVKKVVEQVASYIHPMLGKLAGAAMSIF